MIGVLSGNFSSKKDNIGLSLVWESLKGVFLLREDVVVVVRNIYTFHDMTWKIFICFGDQWIFPVEEGYHCFFQQRVSTHIGQLFS